MVDEFTTIFVVGLVYRLLKRCINGTDEATPAAPEAVNASFDIFVKP
jgi:hypothetical protein